MKNEFNRKAPNWPTDHKELKQLERQIEFGEFGVIPPVLSPHSIPRYLVTYMNSQTTRQIRSATVVSVTNMSQYTNKVYVAYFKGLTNNSSPICVSAYSIPPDFTIDFCTRYLPIEITCCNSVCNPELNYDEGRAIVSSMLPEIGVSSRVYYTEGEKDEKLLAVTDSKIVVFRKYNMGD
jgi:hypothetical protein